MAGGVCGTLWVLSIAMILAAARPGTLTDLPLLAVGVVVALSTVVLLSGPGRSRPAGSAGAELSGVILGVTLAGTVATVGLSVGGLLAGVLLVFLGDRLLRQLRQARRGRAMQPQPSSEGA